MKRILPHTSKDRDRDHHSNTGNFNCPMTPLALEAAETEADRQLKELLKRQMKTDYTIQSQFEKHREFKSAKTYRPLTSEISGALAVQDFRKKAELKDRVELLRLDGLDDDEIGIRLKLEGYEVKSGHFGMEPSVLNDKVEEISAKIAESSESAVERAPFRGAKCLTRHEMQIEKSLKPNCASTKYLGVLVTAKEALDGHPDDPINHLKEMEENLMNKIRDTTKVNRKRRKRNLMQRLDVTPGDVSTVSELTWGDVTPIEDQEIISNRLGAEEIKTIPRFANYTPGNPSKRLFVKNLSDKVDRYGLMSLFGKFQDVIEDIRLMRGKMKGQAFVTFRDVDEAQRAFDFLNGYNFKGKPVVIQFGLQCT